MLERLGMKDFARVAELSAKQAFDLLLKKHKEEEDTIWTRFETEIVKRVAEVTQKHDRELQVLEVEKKRLEIQLEELKKSEETKLKNAKESERLEVEKTLRKEIAVLDQQIRELLARIPEVTQKHNEELQVLEGEKKRLAIQLEELKKAEETKLKNAKESERLDAEKRLQEQIATLDQRIRELEAAAKVADKEKAAEIQKVKTELEAQLQSLKAELHRVNLSNDDLVRKLQDYLKEITEIRTEKEKLQAELEKIARVGKREEVEFAEEARSWPGIYVSEKLSRHGDYLLAFRDASGAPLDPKMVVDNKDKDSHVTEADIDKLVRDASERSLPVAVLVTRDENQLRQCDRDTRWAAKYGVWILRTTRHWLPRDLEVLRPLFERMRVEGPDFLTKNGELAKDVRRTLVDLDELEKELKKAAKAISTATDLAAAYKQRLQTLCDNASGQKIAAQASEALAQKLARDRGAGA